MCATTDTALTKTIAAVVTKDNKVFDGDIWKISPMPEKEAVDAYLKYQGRFKKMSVSE
jgi:hypothetical protein